MKRKHFSEKNWVHTTSSEIQKKLAGRLFLTRFRNGNLLVGVSLDILHIFKLNDKVLEFTKGKITLLTDCILEYMKN